MRFTDSLQKRAQAGYIPVIPDFKMISPAEGMLLHDSEVIMKAVEMERVGAPALSVVTESEYFGGSRRLLSNIVEAVEIPILRKDFIRTIKDVEETVRMGASAILLICSCMSEETLRELYHASLELGVEPLVETHTEEEMRLAASLKAKLIGVNNRDILMLERDGGNVNTTVGLSVAKPKNALLISESGIQNTDDVCIAVRTGADAVLVGTAIWKAENPFAYYRELSRTKV